MLLRAARACGVAEVEPLKFFSLRMDKSFHLLHPLPDVFVRALEYSGEVCAGERDGFRARDLLRDGDVDIRSPQRALVGEHESWCVPRPSFLDEPHVPRHDFVHVQRNVKETANVISNKQFVRPRDLPILPWFRIKRRTATGVLWLVWHIVW